METLNKRLKYILPLVNPSAPSRPKRSGSLLSLPAPPSVGTGAGRQGLTLSELFAIFKQIYYAGNRRVNIFPWSGLFDLKRVLKNDKVTHQIKI